MKVILGSQSPQRLALLKTIVSNVCVLPPRNGEEPGFDDLHSADTIAAQLQNVVDLKFSDVQTQVSNGEFADQATCLICADTVVVATAADGRLTVLGKPPSENWKSVVRDWFERFYAGGEHDVWTGFRIDTGTQQHQEIVKTSLTLRDIDEELLEWYLSTNEPVGKAGGYGVQGIAAMFVESMQGSLTNVVGLPMFELTSALRNAGVLRLSNA